MILDFCSRRFFAPRYRGKFRNLLGNKPQSFSVDNPTSFHKRIFACMLNIYILKENTFDRNHCMRILRVFPSQGNYVAWSLHEGFIMKVSNGS